MAFWESFYVIVGSAGAALIAVQFVVVTLVASIRRRPPAEALSAFGTPTVVHFTAALLISAVMSVPWPSLRSASIALAACGFGGLGYSVVVILRTRRQTDYAPVWQDWVWYTLFPFGAYTALALTSFFLRSRTGGSLFVVAATALGLLLIGIHNSWDSVMHLIVVKSDDERAPEQIGTSDSDYTDL